MSGKRGYIVTGPEGSGSVFIAQVISYVIGHCRAFGDWDGYGFNDDIGADNCVLHRSVPYLRPKRFPENAEVLSEPFAGYDHVKIILCAREPSISIQSKIRRMDQDPATARRDIVNAMPLFADLLSRDDVHVWSYEAMLLFGVPYFARLYRFLGIESDFTPTFIDGNVKYIRAPGG